ncbi:MAG: hypothetical protein KKC51_04225 [Verrucomicrobia bacterium]|nr:hypothetical protein [Verrucomicrobiota bacterium]
MVNSHKAIRALLAALCWVPGAVFAANHFVESFDTLSCAYADTTTVLPSGTWTVNNVYNEEAVASRGGTGHAARINDDISGAHLTTPALDTVGTVSFYYRELNTGGGTFKVQKSAGGGSFSDVTSQAFSGTNFTFYSVDVNDASSAINIRILNDNNPGHLIIDDMTVTDYASAPSNEPPILAAIGNKVTDETVPLQFAIQATDPVDGDPITLTMSNAPAGAVLSSTNGNGTFTWSLPSPDGVYTTSFYAADKDGADFETITITVLAQTLAATSNLWDFEDGWQTWTNYSRFSNKNWSRANLPGAESTDWKMEMSGYQADTSSDDWLLSPALDFSAVTDPHISFWTKRENSGPDITVKLSTNYPGTGDPLAAGVLWATLPFTRPSSQSVWAQWTNDLSAYVGQGSVYIAFYYTSTRTRATRWSVDQIRYWATAVGASNEPPVLGPIGDKWLIVSNNLLFPVTAVDPVDDDPITLTVSNAPAGSEFSATNGNGYFTWLSAAPVGVYTSSFYAADKDGADFETIVITISEPPGPTNLPVLASIGNKSVAESNALNFAVSASDLDGDTITLIASNLPAGAVFSSTNENGNFSWPQATPAGVYTTLFYAVDNDGADSETVLIYVNAAAPTGTIVFQGFDGSGKDTWAFTGGGSNAAAAARTDGYGRQLTATDELVLTNVSLVGHSSMMLSLHCASTGGIENLDSLEIYVALDGAAFSDTPDITLQEGNTTDAVYNATWSYSANGVAHTTAGTPATFNGDGSEGYSTIRIRIPDGSSSVRVKIASANSTTGEYYYVDDVELTSGTWDFNDPPVLASVGSREGSQGASLIFTVSASDPDEDAVSLVASNLPAGAVFVDHGNGSGDFNWAYPAVTGSWAVTFHVFNADGSDLEQIAIFIDEAVVSTNVSLTVMAANLSSGTDQAYHDPGIRIFQGLKPDVACLQEFNYASGARVLVDTAFSTGHYYYVETDGEQIPNGIISKYPILSSGQWVDPYVSNRDMAWAIIDIPGTQELHVVSVHFLTTGSTERNNQATYLKGCIQTNWPGVAYIAIAGDLNTPTRVEACHTTLSTIVTDSIPSKDQNGDMDTNAGRDSDYDYVLPSTALNSLHTSTVVGGLSFTNGVVFDSRLWASPPDPIQSSDSGVEGMQHMAVMKTFALQQAAAPVTSAVIYVLAGPHGSISPTNAVVNFGQNKTFTIAPATNYSIADVKVDGTSIGATNTYTFSNVTNHHSLAATFASSALTLTIVDLAGPASGSSQDNAAADSQQNCVNTNLLVTAGTTQFVLTGWSRTGASPGSGTSNSTGPFTMTTNAEVTWLWFTNYWFNSGAGAGGSVNVTDRWAALGSNITITATADAYYDFNTWTGDAPVGEETNATIMLTMDGPRQVTATFAARLAVHDVPQWWLASHGWTSDFDNAALDDQDGDTMFTWEEYVAGTIPTNKLSLFQVDTRRAGSVGPAVLTWPSASGRLYDVDARTNACLGDWAIVVTNLQATVPVNTYTGSMDQSECVLFRVRVRQP